MHLEEMVSTSVRSAAPFPTSLPSAGTAGASHWHATTSPKRAVPTAANTFPVDLARQRFGSSQKPCELPSAE